MAVLGTHIHARMRQMKDTWKFCSGLRQLDVLVHDVETLSQFCCDTVMEQFTELSNDPGVGRPCQK